MMQKRIEVLQIELKETIIRLAEAKAHGDLKENAEYKAALEKKAYIEQENNKIRHLLSISEVVEKPIDCSVVRFGSLVTLRNLDTGDIFKFTVASSFESTLNNVDFRNYETEFVQTFLKKPLNACLEKNNIKYQIIEIS